jgi:hypothetical protein
MRKLLSIFVLFASLAFADCTWVLNPFSYVPMCVTIAASSDSALYCADAGSTDAYACNLSPAITAYVTGQYYRFKANTANTGAATLALNGIATPVNIKKVAGGVTTVLNDNDIRAGQMVTVVYDGTNFQLVSALGNSVNAPLASGDIPANAANTSGTAAALSAALTEARFPALDGDVTTAAGDFTTTIANAAVTLAKTAYTATNPQSDTTYAILTGDRQKLVTLTNGAAIAVSIAAAGSTGFPDGWETTVLNSGAGTATITPATSTIEGAATFTLTTGQSARIISNGTNYRAVRSRNTLVSADIPNNAADTSGKATTAGAADTVTNGVTATGNIGDGALAMGSGGAKVVAASAVVDDGSANVTVTNRNVVNRYAHLKFVSEATPGAPTAGLGDAGSTTAGTHACKITFVTANGETEAGAASGTVTVTGAQEKIELTSIPTGTATITTGRNVYCHKAGVTTTYYLVATSPVIPNNTATTYSMNIADASFTATTAPTGDTTAGWLFMDGIPKLKIDPVSGTLSVHGNVVSTADGSYDLGAWYATRFRNIFITGILWSAGICVDPGCASSVKPGAGTGQIVLLDNSGDNFNRLTWGHEAATHPSLKRSGTTLQVRLGDDSAYASFTVRSTNYTAQVEGGCGVQTDFVIDGSDTNKITSASYTFVAADVGGIFQVTAGTGFTVGDYTIASVAAGTATMDRAVGTAGSTGGTASYNRGRQVMAQGGAGVADTIRMCGKAAADTYSWVALATY